jgi:hypothetical protein
MALRVIAVVSEQQEPKCYDQLARIGQLPQIDMHMLEYMEDVVRELDHNGADAVFIVDNRFFQGAKAVHYLREHGYAGAVIAYAWPGTIAACFRAGATDVVAGDPYDDAVVRTIENAVKKAHGDDLRVQRRVFLSHASKDHGFAARLADDLVLRGLSVWYDKWRLRVGDSIVAKVQEGLAESATLVVVLSPASARSKWVAEELNSFLWSQLSEKGHRVLPVLYQDCEVPTFLREKVYADFRKDYFDGLRGLLHSLLPKSTIMTGTT